MGVGVRVGVPWVSGSVGVGGGCGGGGYGGDRGGYGGGGRGGGGCSGYSVKSPSVVVKTFCFSGGSTVQTRRGVIEMILSQMEV